MTRLLRTLAIAIAVAAIVDPVIAQRVRSPLPIRILMPRPSNPDYARAAVVRDQVVSALAGRAVLEGADAPRALVAIGAVRLTGMPDAPLFSIPLAARPSLAIHALQAPAVLPGQRVPVTATLRAVGLAGRTSTVSLLRSGIAVDVVEHGWTTNDEVFEAKLGFMPAGAGVHRVRITATTPDVEAATAGDLAVVARERRLRVLVFEPRPSWPAAFVRRTLEGDVLFDVTATARITSRVATQSAGAPLALAALQADRFDAILVGAPEALTDADVRALEAFVSRRGGALILLPDRRRTDALGRRFGLPTLEEVVLARPLAVDADGASLQASELLLAPAGGEGFVPLALVRQKNQDRAAILSVVHGAGRVIVAGALDAWRYRADPKAAFDMFWRGLAADAAAAAPPRLTVTIQPSIAAPGDEMLVSVAVRPTEFSGAGGVIEIPRVTAELVSTDGSSEALRLWPGEIPGTYEARLMAPRAGQYALSVRTGDASADAPLVVAADAIGPEPPAARALAFAASVSGGAIVAGAEELAARLDAIAATEVERPVRPMRSPWWIVPFAGLLCGEWALRRRSGHR